MCNVPIQLSADVIAAYLTEYGDVEDVIKAKSTSGTAHGDHYFTMCLNRTGFQSIPQTIEYKNQTMTVVVEGRKPNAGIVSSWGISPELALKKTTKPIPSNSTTATSTTATTILTDKDPKTVNGDNPDREGWTQVVCGNKKKVPFKNTKPEKKHKKNSKTKRLHRYHCYYYYCTKRKIITINNKSTTKQGKRKRTKYGH